MWAGRTPTSNFASAYCYDTLIMLMTLAVVVLPLCGSMRAAKQYTITCVELRHDLPPTVHRISGGWPLGILWL